MALFKGEHTVGSFSIWHWLVVLVIVLLVFGTKKLRNMGNDLGGAIKGFKEGLKEGGLDEGSDNKNAPNPQAQANNQPTAGLANHKAMAEVIDVEVQEKPKQHES